ncbi:MAG: hypothetical protein ACRDNF_19680 [Streptosporangiaceae bacterium]
MSGTDARAHAPEEVAANTGVPAPGTPAQDGPPSPAGQPRHRGRWVALVLVVAVVAAAVVVAVTNPFKHPAGSGTAAPVYSTGAATVKLGSLTSQTQVDATLGDAGTYSVVNEAQGTSGSSSDSASSSSAAASAGGTITELPQLGQTVRQGQTLYAVSGSPVVLLYGNVPSYRDLAEGDTGSDVTELNADLVKLGYVTSAELGPRSGWDYYSAVTADGVDALQLKFGQPETGALDLGQAVFLPTSALITGYGTSIVLGASVAAGTVVLTASSTAPLVTIPLDAADQSDVKVGDHVAVTLPDGATTPGVVSLIDTAATAPSSSSSSSDSDSSSGSDGSSSGTGATITVEVTLSHPKAGAGLNQAPVVVTITTSSASDVLIVPVDALLAQSNGGYAVEVTSGRSHHLVTVTPGLFDDAAGTVQVTGPGLTAGQRVVVPAT